MSQPLVRGREEERGRWVHRPLVQVLGEEASRAASLLQVEVQVLVEEVRHLYQGSWTVGG